MGAYAYRGQGASAVNLASATEPDAIALRAQHAARAAATQLGWAVEVGLDTADGIAAAKSAARRLQEVLESILDLEDPALLRPFDPPIRVSLPETTRNCNEPGTKEGVARHKKAHEKLCEACRLFYNREHARRFGHGFTGTKKTYPTDAPQHGTNRGYFAHSRRGDPRACRPCKLAHAEHERLERAAKRQPARAS